MAKRQFQLNETEIGQLRAGERQSRRTTDLRRLQAVRFYGSGASMTQIMDISGCAESSIRECLQRYRPDQLLSPQVQISTGRFWTVSDLRMMDERLYGVVYADSGSYHTLFHRCAFSYQRAERVYKSRPSAAEIADFEAELEKE